MTTELEQRVTEAVKKDFPIIRTGIDENGKWFAKPLEDDVFNHIAKAAIAEVLEALQEERCIRHGAGKLYEPSEPQIRTLLKFKRGLAAAAEYLGGE